MASKFRYTGKMDGFRYHALCKYTPLASSSDPEDRMISDFIRGFKNPYEWITSSRLIGDALNVEYENLSDWGLAVIPASTFNKTTVRFRPFVNEVCSRYGLQDHYSLITVRESHQPTKGRSVINKIQWLNFGVPPPKIFLFDDVINTGQTFIQVAKKLKTLGAREIVGVMLGKASFNPPKPNSRF